MEYFKIGKLVATYGFKGDIVLQHSMGKKTSFKGLETVFIEDRQDSFLPYFVQDCKIKNDGEVFIKLEGYDTKEKAHTLLQKEIWFTDADFKKFAKSSAPISLLGYSIYDDEKLVGEIIEVIEQPHQLLCKVIIHDNGVEALIPLHEEFLEKVDKKAKKVYVNLPEGLLDIYN